MRPYHFFQRLVGVRQCISFCIKCMLCNRQLCRGACKTISGFNRSSVPKVQTVWLLVDYNEPRVVKGWSSTVARSERPTARRLTG